MTLYAIEPGKTRAESLDRQVARDVMGWRLLDDGRAWSPQLGTVDLADWHPSESFGEDARRVMCRLQELGFLLTVGVDGDYWVVMVSDSDCNRWGTISTPATRRLGEAVCFAALRIVRS